MCYYRIKDFKKKEGFVENKDLTGTIDNAPPAGMLNQLRLQRFAKIFFNLAIAVSVLIAIALLSTVVTPLLFIFALIILIIAVIGLILFTAGAAFFMPGNPVGLLWGLLSGLVGSSDSMGEFVKFCFNITKWISVVGVVLSAIAILFLSVSKSKQNFVVKIVVLSILIVVMIAIFVFHMLTGGMQ